MFFLTLLTLLLLTLLALITISTPHPCTASLHPPAAQLTTPLFNHSLHPLSLKGGETFKDISAAAAAGDHRHYLAQQ
jgi:hypothetical protein